MTLEKEKKETPREIADINFADKVLKSDFLSIDDVEATQYYLIQVGEININESKDIRASGPKYATSLVRKRLKRVSDNLAINAVFVIRFE